MRPLACSAPFWWRPSEDKSAVPSCHCPGDMAVHMRKAYWPYRGVDSVCFCAEYGLVVLCLGLEAGELFTCALGASQDQRTHQQSLRMRPSYLRTHRHPPVNKWPRWKGGVQLLVNYNANSLLYKIVPTIISSIIWWCAIWQLEMRHQTAHIVVTWLYETTFMVVWIGRITSQLNYRLPVA